jgi:hypothetical protein
MATRARPAVLSGTRDILRLSFRDMLEARSRLVRVTDAGVLDHDRIPTR